MLGNTYLPIPITTNIERLTKTVAHLLEQNMAVSGTAPRSRALPYIMVKLCLPRYVSS